MLVRESRALDGWEVRIIGSDISRKVLGRARAARYTQFEVNRGLPAHLLADEPTPTPTTLADLPHGVLQQIMDSRIE